MLEIFTIERYDQNRNERLPFENKWLFTTSKSTYKAMLLA